METSEDFHQSIAAQLDGFHGQRLAKRDEVIASLVAENAGLRAQLQLSPLELPPPPPEEGATPTCQLSEGPATLLQSPQSPRERTGSTDSQPSRQASRGSWIQLPILSGAMKADPWLDPNGPQSEKLRGAVEVDNEARDDPVGDASPSSVSSKEADPTRQASMDTLAKIDMMQQECRLVPQSIKEESQVRLLTFMDAQANVIQRHSILERHFPCVRSVKRCLGRWLPEPMTGFLPNIVEGDAFKLLSALVITLNYFFIVAQSDYKLNNLGADDSVMLVNIGYCFNAFYILELLAQMKAGGKVFFLGPEYGWNMFDFAIVAVAVVELIVKFAGATFVNTSFLRIIRFLRISRVLRMFSAMRMFKEIKVMVDTLSGSFSLFFWCTLFFMLFLSLISIFFVQGAASHLEDTPNADPLYVDELMREFGSVSKGMLSLFMAATGGNDWIVYHKLVKQLGPAYENLFLFYILFYCVAFINVITSVFCEKVMRIAKPETSELIARRQEVEVKDAKEMLHLLTRVIEDDGSRVITRETFEAFISHPEVELYFEVRGLRGASAQRFFKLLCEVNETDKVDFAVFISACVKLDGYASSIDAHCLNIRQLHSMHQIQAMQTSQHQELKLLHCAMKDSIGKLLTHAQHHPQQSAEHPAPRHATAQVNAHSNAHSSFHLPCAESSAEHMNGGMSNGLPPVPASVHTGTAAWRHLKPGIDTKPVTVSLSAPSALSL